ncbi:MAG TPA: penicillin acylase family protein [Gemmatimonadaceae bacterium]|nr:penicillin acylase family protein [Gemmatimonadaceae bacterium]
MTFRSLRHRLRAGALMSLAAAGSACAAPAVQPVAVTPASGAEILWDDYGVPHIFAADREALAYAWGWAQMQNHGDLLLRLYAQGRGRAAEYLGQSYLREDRWVWTMGVPQRSQAWLVAQAPDMRAHISAFVRGINAFAAAHPQLVGDSLRAMLPVVETDVMGHAQRWAFSAFVTSRASVEQSAESWEQRGSNAWAIAPSRSVSGHAMLLANPHLPWGDMFTWMEGQFVIPGVNISGAALVGSPVLQIAFNDRLGWTHTVNTQDGADLYELTVTGDGYAWDGATRAFDTEMRVLTVRARDGTTRPDTLRIRRSVHGPVVRESSGRALALRTVGEQLAGWLEQWWGMGTARNLAEFERAIRPNVLSTQNITYADADGRIMLFYGGNTPVRPLGDRAYWADVVPGTTSSNLWTGLHPFEDMPRIVDPPSGWLQNANDPPWWATFPAVLDRSRYPAYLAPTEMSLRAQQSAELLESNGRATFEGVIRSKHSTEMELANRVLGDLIAAAERSQSPRVAQAAAVLRSWDRYADSGSVGAVLFVEWWRGYENRLGASSPFAEPWNASVPRSTPRGLADPAAATAALDSAAALVLTRYGSLAVPWGDVYRVRRDSLDLAANGAFGDLGVFRSVGYRGVANDRYVVAGGDSYVAVIEFGPTVRAASVIGYGNASRAGSPHRTDQLSLFAEQRLKPVWRGRAEIEQNLARRERF